MALKLTRLSLGTTFFTRTFDAGTLLFPVTYILGDVITEVYGTPVMRRLIITTFVALIFSTTIMAGTLALPPAPEWPHQKAFEVTFSPGLRICIASPIAYLFGNLTNSLTLQLIKKMTGDPHRWLRFIGSTLVGEAVDTSLFVIIAFAGVYPLTTLIDMWVVGYTIKVLAEIPVLPLSTLGTYWLKR
jgi:uncharacterized integral membrane protein (TIGR00697 family)